VKLGLIGVSKVGAPTARRLPNAGHELVVHDTNSDATQPFMDIGGVIADSPADVGDRAETVQTSLPTPNVVRRGIVGCLGCLGSNYRKGSTYRRRSFDHRGAHNYRTIRCPGASTMSF
jgi:3-hydroxyisobutyrate dehydrogenase-like beta-hydroxyacid dehydrogenase